MSSKSQTPVRILLAEDDTDDRLFFEKALMEIPIVTELTSVANGEELMVYLNDNLKDLPDVLFLDLSMPRKTGFECLTEIKEHERLKNLSVIVFTTPYGSNNEFEKSLMLLLSGIGAQEYIRKSSDPDELKLVIQKILMDIKEKKNLQGSKIKN
jgi:CheY-like chemotaxis protein